MAPLTYFRSILIAAVHPNIIRVTNLGKCKLRLINVVDVTDVCLHTCEIVHKNIGNLAGETISVFRRMQQIAADFDVGWEGEIDLGSDQDLMFRFEDAVGTAPTAGDVLVATIGFEMP